MKLKEYLWDRKYLIVFFIVLMVFIGGMVFFDSSTRMLKSNGLYLTIVSFMLFTVYLAIDYISVNYKINKISNIPKEGEIDWVNGVPSPKNYEEKFYLGLLNRLYKDANIQIEKLNYKNAENVEFLTTWVHEIKTPIAASKLMIENNLNCENEKVLFGLEGEIERIEDYVQKALFYSRINDFSKDYRIDNIKLETVVKESIKNEASCFINKEINLHFESLDMEVDSDYKWLQFIIKQIIDNAVKYTEKGGTIKIYTELSDKEKLLHIEDNGIGIKKEDIERVFDKSFTGYNGRVKHHSTGMGLYISQKLARKLGHYITITSEYNKGTIVSIHFPKWKDYYKWDCN